MKLSELPYGPVQSAVFKLIQGMGDAGDGAQGIVDRINSDESFVDRVAKLVLTDGYEPSTSHQRAREIMGKNFFGIEEARKHFGVNPTKQQLGYLTEIPFSEDVLAACKDTHVLAAVFPISILEIRSVVDKVKMPSGQRLVYKQDWYDNQTFAQDKGEVGWQLIRKEPIVNSLSKNWNEQQALLSKDEETPKAQVMTYVTIGHFLATGERLFEKVYVRCSDLASGGDRVCVGVFGAGGFIVCYCWGDRRDGNVGLSSARKQQ